MGFNQTGKSYSFLRFIAVLLVLSNIGTLFFLIGKYTNTSWYFLFLPLATITFSIGCFVDDEDARHAFVIFGLIFYVVGLLIFGVDYVTALSQTNYLFGTLVFIVVLINVAVFIRAKQNNPLPTMIFIEGALMLFAGLLMLNHWYMSFTLFTAFFAKLILSLVIYQDIKTTLNQLTLQSQYMDMTNEKIYNETITQYDMEKMINIMSMESGEFKENISDRLLELKRLLAQELISEEEYEELRRRILDSI